ncbi:sensor histidine kinase [Lacinutrix himadriensis]|uniref:sensor histidine kinase n=1 Tax=Lacinutrix himadriensis TaxID=641549 RepID=UPI0006E2E869|nr:HAMP domain-containing sensor histidine kinase [Lacinutrix himadriensis]
MVFPKNRNLIRWVIIIASFAIISLILWNTYVFFQKFKAEERVKMENWSFAQNEFLKVVSELSTDENASSNLDLTLKILSSNNTTPMIVVDKDSAIVTFNNIGQGKKSDSLFVIKNVKNLITQFSAENVPVDVNYEGQILYYGNSPLLNKLKYYPLALLLIIILFAAVVYFFYRSNKTAIENKLWSGMAKETAHQIGTPLSSLIGWAEILKIEKVNPEYIKEIEKDISRLQTITERFSKIGSLPKLERTDIVAETLATTDYLKTRLSKLIDFEIIVPENKIFVNLNKQLYSWTIENLVKNGIDAMKGKGKLKIEILQLENNISINITDSGKGLAKNQFKDVFEPGYTTKKRGWGLGLSLAKRIIEEFHDGKIKVLQSEIGKGTTMQIALKSI